MKLFGFLVIVVAVVAALLFVTDFSVADASVDAPKFIVKVIGGVEPEGPKMITRVVEKHPSLMPPRTSHAQPYTEFVYSVSEDDDSDEVYYFGETTYYDRKSDTYRMLVRSYYDRDNWRRPYHRNYEYWYEDAYCYDYKSNDKCDEWWEDFCDDYEWHRKC